ncbi:MAG: gliding motility-associated C-terminal domain-containing protein [Lewinellaceae bacterium]|nr:gliding motility-associated C-terminal domain-containing protein [Lewinellaceae bacterium]
MRSTLIPVLRFAISFLIIFPGFATLSFSQLSNHGNIWYFGNGGGLDFSSGQPVKLTNINVDSYEGCAVYCDVDGQMLLYTNGGGFVANAVNGPREGIIWNRDQQVMYNMGSTEGGGYSSAQSAIILPKPGGSTEYYVFTMDHGPSLDVPGSNRGLSYFVVDMTLNGGLGAVTQANVPVFKPCVESLTAIPRGDNTGYWLVTIDRVSNDFVVVPVTEAGVGTPLIRPRNGDAINVLIIKASPDGKYLCADGEIYTFDNNTGELTYLTEVMASNYTLSFSPRSRYLYSFESDASTKIVRYDLTAADIPASSEMVNQEIDFSFAGQMQIGPDYNIYFIEQLEDDFLEPIPPVSLSVIKCPDGDKPVLERAIMKFDTDINNAGGLFTSLPNFADYIFAREGEEVTLPVSICDTAGRVLSPPLSGISYIWSTGETTEEITVKTAGTYTVTVEDTCDFYRYTFQVESMTTETASLEAPVITDTCSALPLTLRAVAPDGSSVEWSDGSTADTLLVEAFGNYSVIVSNSCGAVAFSYSLPEPEGGCCRPFTPNAFTPNGDGVNDLFSPVLMGCEVASMEFRVYSRWGELMYEGLTPTDRWDGTTLNGTDAPSDIYVYTARYRFEGDTSEKTESGDVALLR